MPVILLRTKTERILFFCTSLVNDVMLVISCEKTQIILGFFRSSFLIQINSFFGICMLVGFEKPILNKRLSATISEPKPIPYNRKMATVPYNKPNKFTYNKGCIFKYKLGFFSVFPKAEMVCTINVVFKVFLAKIVTDDILYYYSTQKQTPNVESNSFFSCYNTFICC